MSNFTRRKFIGTSMVASGSLMMPGFLKALDTSLRKNPPSNNNKLVVIHLSGGNDGLNTVIPVRNDLYYKSRPVLGIKKEKALSLSDEYSLNNAMKSFAELYDSGNLSIINGVGYPNPDFSHFRAVEIWQTGSERKEMVNSGWLGRYLDSQCVTAYNPHHMVQVDSFLGLAMRGNNISGISYRSSGAFKEDIDSTLAKDILINTKTENSESYIDFLYKAVTDSYSSFDYLKAHNKEEHSATVYPDTSFGKKMRSISGFINGGAETRVYFASLLGFDTHAKQPGTHEKLLGDLSDSVYALIRDLKKNKKLDEVCIMVFSEFGRRLEENASIGTDHGTASNVYLLGGKLQQKGIYNPMPNLADLDSGNLKYTVDFRSIYATLLKKWLGADDELILKNKFPILNFI